MSAAAFRYAHEGGTPPRDLQLSILIRDYGVEAVLNRRYLGAGEINRMRMTERIIEWYRDRQHSPNWVEWAKSNPDASAALNRAERAAYDE